jgi:hypothetical protein
MEARVSDDDMNKSLVLKKKAYHCHKAFGGNEGKKRLKKQLLMLVKKLEHYCYCCCYCFD